MTTVHVAPPVNSECNLTERGDRRHQTPLIAPLTGVEVGHPALGSVMTAINVLIGRVVTSLLGCWWADAIAGLVIAGFAVRKAIAAAREDACAISVAYFSRTNTPIPMNPTKIAAEH